jgi:hypothetical protein
VSNPLPVRKRKPLRRAALDTRPSTSGIRTSRRCPPASAGACPPAWTGRRDPRPSLGGGGV